MIVARFLSKQLLLTTCAITLILLLVVMSSEFARYAERAAEGKIAIDIILPVLIFAVPQTLELIIPLSFFLAILVSFGQLYESSEMTALHACGISRMEITRITLANSLFVSVIVAGLTFFVTPQSKIELQKIVAEQGLQSELGNAAPGRFYELSGQQGAVHALSFTEDRSEMQGVFIRRREASSLFAQSIENVLWAERGYAENNENGGHYFVLEEGISYRGIPGQADFEISKFGELGQLLDDPEPIVQPNETQEYLNLFDLLASNLVADKAELNWRISMALLIFIVTLIALPLSKTDARAGRFAQIIPAIILYLLYIVSLNAGKGLVIEGKTTPLVGIWSTHLLFLAVGAWLFFAEDVIRWSHSRRDLRTL